MSIESLRKALLHKQFLGFFLYRNIETNIDELQEIGQDAEGHKVPSSSNPEYESWLDKTCERISAELEELNTRIEHYLADIDKKYGTNYNPSGATRL